MKLEEEKPEKQQFTSSSGRGIAALELAEAARDLKQIADTNGFKMVSYLLDLVVLESLDCRKSISDAEKMASKIQE